MGKSKPKILFVWTKNSGVAWYRIIQFASAIAELDNRELGKDVFYPPWNSGNELGHQWEYEMMRDTRTATDFFAPLISEADVVIFQTVATQIGCSLFLSCKDLGKIIFTETDDLETHVPYTHPASTAPPGNESDHWLNVQVRSSHGVICSTKYLVDKIKPVNPNCHVIPNCINFSLWDQVKRSANNGKLRIGWIGGASHEGDLAIIEEPCIKISEKYKAQVEFWFIGGPPTWAENRPGFYCKHPSNGGWAPVDRYHHFLGGFGLDIGLAPLRDNEFNRAKSNLRWLEYSALKIPTIASDVEPFNHNLCKPIALCNSEFEWQAVIESTIESKQARKEIGQLAYERCKEDYNIKTIAKNYLRIIEETYNELINA